ncbi:hypothetical protein [Sulfurimonas sp.]|uniref:hypothetical protein n=1 Tax=Sulfurimonas sp. TaxID=2022749 RepID=UPI0025E39EB9|nr:hypothetical protein [Sulfurimonas sp.]
MSKFYFFLWIRWSIRLTLCSTIFASIISFLITISIYTSQGMANLSSEVTDAIINVFLFWFPVVWSFTLLLALFRALKYIFNVCISGYMINLYSCDGKELLQDVGYGDIVKVWRKWFMLIIWLVGSLMILSIVFTYIFTSYSGVFEWFNIYWLFAFLLVSGYFSFMFMTARCKRIKVVKC